MIYVSSSCVKSRKIVESVDKLSSAGFRYIELSGGTHYYEDYEIDLLRLQEKYDLNYLVHNYFPPPTTPFIVNLASLDDDIFFRSIDLCSNAIRLSKKLGGTRYGIHGGFLYDFSVDEVGKNISYSVLSDRDKALSRFREAWDILNNRAAGDVTLYVENNVFSWANAQTFPDECPFLITHYEGYLELAEYVQFNLLLDVAHLKVSANSLGLDYFGELEKLFQLADYVHLSDNDGYSDQNNGFNKNSSMLNSLENFDWSEITVVLETYCELEQIKESFDLVKNFYMEKVCTEALSTNVNA